MVPADAMGDAFVESPAPLGAAGGVVAMARTHAVLVTGSAGRIGRAVSAELVARGHRVRGFDRVPSPALRETVVGDVANPDDLGARARRAWTRRSTWPPRRTRPTS